MRQFNDNLVSSLIATVALGAVAKFSEYISPDPTIRNALLFVTGAVVCVILMRSYFARYLQMLETTGTRLRVESDARKALAADDLLDKGGLSLLNMLHHARDASVRYMPSPAGAYEPPALTREGKPQPDPVLEQNRELIINMLNNLVDIFREIAPKGTKVWASLRDRRADQKYHTFERAGAYSLSRKSTSQPLDKDRSRTVRELKLSYENGSCVILTGSSKGESKWQPQPNDRLGENLCVLMGAVMTKSPSDGLRGYEWKNAKLTWIVSVNADREDAFNDNHRHIMRCCIVAFSWLANTLIRKDLFIDIPESRNTLTSSV